MPCQTTHYHNLGLADGALIALFFFLIVVFLHREIQFFNLKYCLYMAENVGGCCLLGKIPLNSLCNFWEKSPNLGLGQRVEVTSPVDMNACFLKVKHFKSWLANYFFIFFLNP
jgi:hypothetical protein